MDDCQFIFINSPQSRRKVIDVVYKSDYESIINLQGDMPMIDPINIKSVNLPLEHGYDIGTIATNITPKVIIKRIMTKRFGHVGFELSNLCNV